MVDFEPDYFDYHLPKAAIAQVPAEPRDSARLLVCNDGEISTRWRVRDLCELLVPGDLLVFNATRTRRARVFARRPSGGKVELLFLKRLSSGVAKGTNSSQKIKAPSHDYLLSSVPNAEGSAVELSEHAFEEGSELWEVLARPSRKLTEGMELRPEEGKSRCCSIKVERSQGDGFWVVRVASSQHVSNQFLHIHGRIPLPPYFKGHLGSEERYQTVFADREGSAASPTAGLHFTKELLFELEKVGIGTAFVYLEIGSDTLRPLRPSKDAGDRGEIVMHSEVCEVGHEAARLVNETKMAGGRVVAVGTTVVRTLESFAEREGVVSYGSKSTALFIRPGYRFKIVDGLLTNFHAPGTSMLHLLGAIYPGWKKAYAKALEEGFRFLSFGDAMLVLSK